MTQFRRYWFFIGLAAACALGYTFPQSAEKLAPSVPYVVALLMFLMGLDQDWQRLFTSIFNLRAIILSLALTFVLMPVLTFSTAILLFPADPVLIAGLMILGAVPTTTASSIIWTRATEGNSSLSLVLTVASTFASILLIPLILKVSIGHAIVIPAGEMTLTLAAVILVPVVLGQLLRRKLRGSAGLGTFITPFGQLLLLTIVLTAVGRGAEQFSSVLIAKLSLIVLLLNTLVSSISLGSSALLGLSRPDAVAVLFASSQKAITIGLMVGLVYFEAKAGLPILVYHVLQQLTASIWSRGLRDNRLD